MNNFDSSKAAELDFIQEIFDISRENSLILSF